MKLRGLPLFCCTLLLIYSSLCYRSYDNYQLADLSCSSFTELHDIVSTISQEDSNLVEIYSYSPNYITLLVNSVYYPEVNDLIQQGGKKCIITMRDVTISELIKKEVDSGLHKKTKLQLELQSLIENHRNGNHKISLRELVIFSEEWFTVYHDYDSIVLYLEALHYAYPAQTQLLDIGLSFENRSIIGIRLSANGFDEKKSEFIFNGCQHAREWISPATVTFLAYSFLSNNSKDVQQLLQEHYYSIIPVVNPDGYSFTWTSDRLWRKNRRTNDRCVGVDLNRNWGYKWNGGGDSSSNQCSATYHGQSAFSEPETMALSSYISQFSGNIAAYIDFHSYSQFILTPWSYTPDADANAGEQLAMGDLMAAAIALTHGVDYQVGDWYTLLYDSSGVASDWVYADASAVFSYTIELRDTGTYGFLLPADQIIPTGQEIFNAMIVLGNHLQ